MDFLKQPRTEPPKKPSRHRTGEKRRDERELEEISAFFLHKRPPERLDMHGRKQPNVSGLSSLEDAAFESSTNDGARHEMKPHRLSNSPRDVSAPSLRSNEVPFKLQGRGSTNDRELSKGPSYFSWSASHASPDLASIPAQPTQNKSTESSSTPAGIREALAHTGVYGNTGIYHDINTIKHADGLHSFPNDKSEIVRQLASNTPQPIVKKRVQDGSVRIVRYQDRGTMATEDRVTSSTIESGDIIRGASIVAERGPGMPQYSTKGISTMAPAAVGDGSNEPPHANKELLTNKSCSISDTSRRENGQESGPSRPKAPRLKLIERLEAEAESQASQYSRSHSATPREAHGFRQNSHLPSSQNASLEVCRPTPLAPTRSRGTAPLPGESPVYKTTPALTRPSTQHTGDGYTAPHYSPWRTSTGDQDAFTYAPRAANGPINPAVPNTVQHVHNDHITAPSRAQRPVPLRVQQYSQQETMQDYIDKIEREVLERKEEEPPEHDFSPWSRPYLDNFGTENPPTGDVEWGNEVSEYQTGAGSRELDRGFRREQGNILQGVGALSADSRYPAVELENLDEDVEEQEFMSNFWRPNQYLM